MSDEHVTTAEKLPGLAHVSRDMRRLQCGLARLGWEILNADINVPAGTVRIELRRGDWLVTFDARNGRASTTRETLERITVKTGRRGDIYLAERLHFRFLGRTPHEGVRSGLRFLSNYVADNAPRPALRGDVRRLLAPVMDGAHALDVQHG